MKTLLWNGKVYVERGRFEEAVLVEDGIIQAVGGNEELKAIAGEAELIDCEGRTVVPGFNDSHLHLLDVGRNRYQASLSGCRSIEELIQTCRDYIEKYPERVKGGMKASGWNQDLFAEKRMPTRHDLDRISTEIPIVLSRVCHHIDALNTKAIEVLGVDENFPEIPGGEIQREENGYPNGIFCEIYEFTRQALPPVSEEELDTIIQLAMDYASSRGLTSVQSNDLHTGSDYEENMAGYHRIYKSGKAKLRYRVQGSFATVEDLKKYVESGDFGPEQEVGELYKMGPVKLFKDGSLGGRTAYMRNEYNDAPGEVGIECVTVEEMDAYCQAAKELGLQVVVHVIGDRAVSETLDAYEKVLVDGKNVHRNALVHCQITDKELLQRIADMDVPVMAQPVFLDYDMTIVEDRCGKELASTSYAFGTLEKLGAHVSYGTDSDVEDCNPLANIYHAVTRKRKDETPEGGFYPEECVDVYTAVDAYTIGSAHAEFAEDKKGRIKPGYFADMVILDKDIFTVDPMEIRDMDPVLTMMDGKVVYRR